MLSLGEVVLLDFPYTNRAGSKVRPGIVIAVSDEHYAGDVRVAYMTSEVDAYAFDPFAVAVSQVDLTEGTLKLASIVRVDKVITVHASRCRPSARVNGAKREELLRKATAYRVNHFAVDRFAPAPFEPGVTPVPPSGKALDWKPRWSLAQALAHTVAWYQAWMRGADMTAFSVEQIHAYETAGPP